ncbi:MAG: histidine phosphatase family protein [Olegusella sp.]|nr:histidine phosphatase family protein [Olegusella sp.]
MKKTLYLMRHGQTLFNVQKVDQGASDAPLTRLGVAQARAAGNHLAQIGAAPDHVFCSPYERTCDTAETVTSCLTADGTPLPYERVWGLREFSFGSYEGKDSYLNPSLPFGDKFVQFGGDAQQDVADRMVATLTELMRRPDVQVALAVSHGAAVANFCRAIAEWSPVKYHPGIKNCSIFTVEFDEETGHFSCVDLFEPDVPADSVPDATAIDFSLMHGAGDAALDTPDGPAVDPAAPKTTWLVRHAETLFNAQNKVQGWCDSPLTERGIVQAHVCGCTLAALGINPDHAFCSTSFRASTTLEILLSEIGKDALPYLRLKGLREAGFGSFEGKDQCLQPSMLDPEADTYYVPYGGEARADIADRMYRTLKAIADRPDIHEALVVGSRGSATSFFYRPEVVREAELKSGANCIIYHYEYADGTFICKEIIVPED